MVHSQRSGCTFSAHYFFSDLCYIVCLTLTERDMVEKTSLSKTQNKVFFKRELTQVNKDSQIDRET